jgi:hypothetical protein
LLPASGNGQIRLSMLPAASPSATARWLVGGDGLEPPTLSV